MTLQQLYVQREEISMLMIESEPPELKRLEEELGWIEELIEELEYKNGKENKAQG